MHPNVYYHGMPHPGAVAVTGAAPATAAVAAPAATAVVQNGTAANPILWYGRTKAQVDHENRVMAQRSGANKPRQLVPHQATAGQSFWVRELNGSYTLRNHETIQSACQPGYWAFAARGGYPYFIRQQAATTST